MAPQISVITPSYKQLDWLRLAAASIADQENVAVEHIVQDGGTGLQIEAWAKKQPKVRLFEEKDAGMYDAVNKGLMKAGAEICAYLNCDEQYLPGTLAKVVDYFVAHPNVDVIFGDAILIDQGGNPISYRRTILPSISHLRLTDLNTMTCSTFFRRRLIDAGYLFPTHLKIAGDQYWVFKLLKAGVQMDVLNEPLSVFTFTGQNLSRSVQAREEQSSWLPKSEEAYRWTAPAVITWHRLKKFISGAYRHRTVTIHLYKASDSAKRQQVSRRIGFKWPRNSTTATPVA